MFALGRYQRCFRERRPSCRPRGKRAHLETNSTTHSSCPTGKAGRGQGKGGKEARAVTNKNYERALDASGETLRHLQRLKVGKSFTLNEITPLVKLPLQLGFCSAHEFENSNDDCKKLSTKTTSARFIALRL